MGEEEPLRKYIQERLSDYSQIRLGQSLSSCRPLLPSDTHSWFIDQIRWLKREIQQARTLCQPVIVLTHHAPSMACSEPDIPPTDPLSHAFCSDLEYLFDDPLVVWAFGHTHFPFDERMGTVRVISNPVGYPFEYPAPYGKAYLPNLRIKV